MSIIWKAASAALRAERSARANRGEITFGMLDHFDLLAGRINFFWPDIEQRPVRSIQSSEAHEFFVHAGSGTGKFSTLDLSIATPQRRTFKLGPQGPDLYNKMLNFCRIVSDHAIRLDQSKGLAHYVNPFANIPYLATYRIPRLNVDTDWDALLYAVRWPFGPSAEEDYLHYAYSKFVLSSGARATELLGSYHASDTHPGFRWQDIHDSAAGEPGELAFKARMKGQFFAQRKVPFISGVPEFVRELRERLYKGNNDARVFAGVSLQTGVNRRLARACKGLGIERITQTDLRCAFIAACVRARVPFSIIAEWVGHNDGGALLAKLFSHLQPAITHSLAKRVSL